MSFIAAIARRGSVVVAVDDADAMFLGRYRRSASHAGCIAVLGEFRGRVRRRF
jgi:hypothetical protein